MAADGRQAETTPTTTTAAATKDTWQRRRRMQRGAGRWEPALRHSPRHPHRDGGTRATGRGEADPRPRQRRQFGDDDDGCCWVPPSAAEVREPGDRSAPGTRTRQERESDMPMPTGEGGAQTTQGITYSFIRHDVSPSKKRDILNNHHTNCNPVFVGMCMLMRCRRERVFTMMKVCPAPHPSSVERDEINIIHITKNVTCVYQNIGL